MKSPRWTGIGTGVRTACSPTGAEGNGVLGKQQACEVIGTGTSGKTVQSYTASSKQEPTCLFFSLFFFLGGGWGWVGRGCLCVCVCVCVHACMSVCMCVCVCSAHKYKPVNCVGSAY